MKLSQIDLNGIIEDVLSTFKFEIKERNIEVSKTNVGSIIGHRESLYLVFQNIISNAIKYQPKDIEHIPKIKIEYAKHGRKDLVTISDNGIGLEKSKIKDIFKPFKRLHTSSDYEGTGLGMSIVSRVIAKHSGSINVESEIGKGTQFIITLPNEDP